MSRTPQLRTGFVAGHDARGVGVFAMHVAATGDLIWRSSFRAPGQLDEVLHDLAVDDDGSPVLVTQGFLGDPFVPGAAPPNLVTKLDDRGEPKRMLESDQPLRFVDDGPSGSLLAAGTVACRGALGRLDRRCSEVTLSSVDDEGDGMKARRVLRGAVATALDVDERGAALIAGSATAVGRTAACRDALDPGDLFVARSGRVAGRPALRPIDRFVPQRTR